MRALGGGVLYLDPNGGQHLEVVQKTTLIGRMKFNEAGYQYLEPLLQEQPYIDRVERWDGQSYDVCLADARKVFDSQKNLVSHYTDYFGLDYAVSDAPWLHTQRPHPPLDLLLTRTLRYQCNYPGWVGLLHQTREVPRYFLGLPFEHEVFEATFGIRLARLLVQDAADALAAIQSAETYVTNQGANHALAVASGRPRVLLEIQYTENVCRFPNREVAYF